MHYDEQITNDFLAATSIGYDLFFVNIIFVA